MFEQSRLENPLCAWLNHLYASRKMNNGNSALWLYRVMGPSSISSIFVHSLTNMLKNQPSLLFISHFFLLEPKLHAYVPPDVSLANKTL